MSKSHADFIRDLYSAFSSGDVPGVLGRMSPDIVWNEAENFPYADGNPYIGPQAVLEGVFARCGSEWDGFRVNIEEILDAGDTVVALGRYTGVYKATGRAQDTQIAHIWRLKDGKVVGFQQHADTLHVARITGSA